MRLTRTLAVIATAVMATAAFAIASPNLAFAQSDATATVATALSGVTNGLVEHTASSISDADSAAQTANADIPFDPATGVTLTKGDQTTVVGLPDAPHLGRGVRANSGVVVYRNPNGSDAVVVPTTDGAQFLTVIEKSSAPEDYAYPLTVGRGGTIRITPSGSALVLDATGKPVFVIAAPWAQDANRQGMTTYFTTNGKTLTQHIAHKASGVRYPVVADPDVARYSTGVVITFNHWDTGVIGATIALTPVWIAAATLSGQDGNKLYQAIWYIQAIAAYDGAVTPSLCLWIWIPNNNDKIDAGGYRC